LILPERHYPNLASKTLSLCLKRLSGAWQTHFDHPLLLVETLIDPAHFQGTLYKASNWLYLGNTRCFSRTRQSYSTTATAPKMLFVYLLQANARAMITRPLLESPCQSGTPKLRLSADKLQSLYDYFTTIPDPRRAQGRNSLPTVLAISTAAVYYGRAGYKGIWDWAKALVPKGRERFRYRYVKGGFQISSESIFRIVLIRLREPEQLNLALQHWHKVHGQDDESLAIDGKT
jgi:hypothetical protein